MPFRSRSALTVVGSLLAITLVVGAALVMRHRNGPKHLRTVTSGVLYRSGQLTPEQLEDVVSRYGVRTVVNLRSENERTRGDWYAREVGQTDALGVRLVDLPMDTGYPPSDAVLAGWLEVLDDPDAAPILVHCEYGVIRTGIMVAVYEIERLGASNAEALRRIDRFGREFPEPIQDRIDAYFADYVPRSRPG